MTSSPSNKEKPLSVTEINKNSCSSDSETENQKETKKAGSRMESGNEEDEEDDHADQAYVNVRVPSIGLFGALSAVFCLIASIGTALFQQQLPNNGTYPRSWRGCNRSLSVPEWGLPSLVRSIETFMLSNIIWRFGPGLVLAPRLLNSVAYRFTFLRHTSYNRVFIYKCACNLLVVTLMAEAVSAVIVAIVTIKYDEKLIHLTAFLTFVTAGTLHMILLTMLQFLCPFENRQNMQSFAIKLIASVIFAVSAPIMAYGNLDFSKRLTCHNLVAPAYGIAEYAALASNVTFHLTSLIDLKRLRFIAYPKSSSGELIHMQPRLQRMKRQKQSCTGKIYPSECQAVSTTSFTTRF